MEKSINNYNCLLCDYNTSILQNYNKHILTLKHKNNSNNAFLEINGNSKNSTNVAIYNCRVCNFNTKNKRNYDNHLLTEKHQNKMNGENNEIKHTHPIKHVSVRKD